jgi:hypothetical protein
LQAETGYDLFHVVAKYIPDVIERDQRRRALERIDPIAQSAGARIDEVLTVIDVGRYLASPSFRFADLAGSRQSVMDGAGRQGVMSLV